MSIASRRFVVIGALVAGSLLAPAVPAIGAVLDGPMVARAGSEAHRASSPIVVGTTAPADDSAIQIAEVIRLANLERARAGRAPLVVHPAVAAAAAAHSADQAAMGRMTHTGSDGSDTGTRLTRAGFTWRAWGENVAAGQRTGQDVMAAWMASAGHRANILSGAFTTIGVGVATGADGVRYWTMDLAA